MKGEFKGYIIIGKQNWYNKLFEGYEKYFKER